MKKIILTTTLGLFLICGLKAQTAEVSVPTNLSEPIVVLGTNYNSGWIFTIEDGTNAPKTTTITLIKGVQAVSQYAGLLAGVCNKIVKQGYKLISSNSMLDATLNGSIYIFQKE